MYLRESPIWRGGVRFLVCIKSIQALVAGFTRGVYNLCETISLITSSSTSGVKTIGLTFLGSSILHMDAKAKLNLEYREIDPTLLQNLSNLLNPA